jgi:KDO2-lipid IV(A) lauroyltransferase
VTPSAARSGGSAVADMTQQLARAFEDGIAAHPQDWHMLQRLWLADLDAGDPRRRTAAEQSEGAA